MSCCLAEIPPGALSAGVRALKAQAMNQQISTMTSPATDIRDTKHALRKAIRSKVSAASNDALVRQSRAGQDLVLTMSEYMHAKRIGVYLSMPVGEASTDILVRDALYCGKAVFVPYLHRPKGGADSGNGRRVMDMLRLQDVAEYAGLERDRWGIPSLSDESVAGRENAMGGVGLVEKGEVEGELDLIVVPGVAFDAEGRRLGHGAGFYDEFLARYCEGGKRRKPYLVGLCLAEQFVGNEVEIPTTEWDWQVDAVAVGDGRFVTCGHA
ncbi:hypothetical protein B0A48_12164 [Cryoendolithus antarcticus]|uniref:5-formyltetrahydrofolate cyclo-ligase n=1 Tax=Cryoendolithus antarcticus TaxID=1507870 RepID=A0A1V8SU05_9PEZI|nr:hypothetical protein B0A48_12164 [Cryoendolithus antarcticus]